MNKRLLFFLAGFVFLLIGLLLPLDLYNPLPSAEGLPLPDLNGVLLLRAAFIVEGLLLWGLGFGRWRFHPLPETARPRFSGPAENGLDRPTAYLLLSLITLASIFLRLYGLNSELWLDEIATLTIYREATFLQIISSFVSSNNHLLNTLLEKLTIALFGEQSWSVRLPAAFFGTLTIPAVYWLARQSLSRWASLGVALLLAVSYHHIFFSQNGRGYSAYLFFSVAATALLIKAWQEERPWLWLLYIVTTLLNLAAYLLSGFVLLAHGLLVGAALLLLWRRGIDYRPLLKRLAGVFGLTALLAFQLYALLLPQMAAYMRAVYSDDPAAGFSPFSLEFLQELLRGLSAGFNPILLLAAAVPAAVIGLAGFLILLRRNWLVTLSLYLPNGLLFLFLISRGLVISPRFFLLMLIAALLTAVQSLEWLAGLVDGLLNRAGQRRPIQGYLAGGVLLLLTLASLYTLRSYYTVPKQAYHSSLTFLESVRQPDEIVIVIHLAEGGYRYYTPRFGVTEGEEYFYVRSLEAFEAVLAANPDKTPILVTTFPRALRINYPDLAGRIESGWQIVHTFPATVGDGQISLWWPE
jgi:4-amino-4-deoxy-L-arabinose transferase-like glycosyltransferase